MNKRLKLLIFLTLAYSILTNWAVAEKKSSFQVSKPIASLLNKYCIDCHEADNDKGDLQLDNLGDVPLKARLETFNKVEAQLFSHIMPPEKKKQPSDAERIALLNWVSQELNIQKASTLESKLKLYRYGNLVPHEKLFSGKITETPFTKPRFWRINEFIYNERVRNIFGDSGRNIKSPLLQDNKHAQGRDLDDKAIIGLPIVFKLSSESGVTYYDTEVINGANFISLKKNADWIVDVQLRPALLKLNLYKYPEGWSKIRPRYRKQRYPQYVFNLKSTPSPFEKIVSNKKNPADTDIVGAINFQFQVAYQRNANSEELKRYLNFMKINIKIGGNVEALRKTLAAILMEPEFFYRKELGENGKLTPREATYAIAYALTDCVPDSTLMTAAQNGKLNSKADYEREVRRILKDDKIAKPRILRFFRDYFGYLKTRTIFKEGARFEGDYNPSKGFSASFYWKVPGKLVDEADLFVKHILKSDKDVLKNLLTSDKYFVAHRGINDNPESSKKEAEARRNAYKYLMSKFGDKNISKKDSKRYKGEIQKKFNVKIARTQSLDTLYKIWRIRYGKDANKLPNYIPDMAHHTNLYNLDYQTWSYEPTQPFKVDNRMGMLTHPTWLIAHAHNCHTDPIVRGKWIQEKLLGGFIPDVPITVDAQIDPDHHKTLRERLGKTEAKDCWGCHKKMNPLGNPFENFDDFGRYRTNEDLEHEDNIVKTEKVIRRMYFGHKPFTKKIYKTKPVNAAGFLDGTGDKTLDGKIKDSLDLISRLGKSERVRQVFVRNVFRYFMGRNEMLSDSKTLIEADKAYVKSGGSFKELMVSILTSDSFIKRRESKAYTLK